jgi:hypothetical protein
MDSRSPETAGTSAGGAVPEWVYRVVPPVADEEPWTPAPDGAVGGAAAGMLAAACSGFLVGVVFALVVGWVLS